MYRVFSIHSALHEKGMSVSFFRLQRAREKKRESDRSSHVRACPLNANERARCTMHTLTFMQSRRLLLLLLLLLRGGSLVRARKSAVVNAR